jgi:hypothetical protein
MKNSVKAMNRNGEYFRYLQQTFPRINDAKIKGPQIKELTNDRNFYEVFEVTEKTAGKHSNRLLATFWTIPKCQATDSWFSKCLKPTE